MYGSCRWRVEPGWECDGGSSKPEEQSGAPRKGTGRTYIKAILPLNLPASPAIDTQPNYYLMPRPSFLWNARHAVIKLLPAFIWKWVVNYSMCVYDTSDMFFKAVSPSCLIFCLCLEAATGAGPFQQPLPAVTGRRHVRENHLAFPLVPATRPHRLPQWADWLFGGAPRHMWVTTGWPLIVHSQERST